MPVSVIWCHQPRTDDGAQGFELVYSGAHSVALETAGWDLLSLSKDATCFGSTEDGAAAVRLEDLESRTLMSVDGWQGYARDPQHTALSTVASQPLGSILWQTPVDLDPQYSGSDLLIHYGSPLITAANTVIVPVKTGATGGFEVQSRSGSSGALNWTLTTDYVHQPSGYDWIPSFSPTLTPSNGLYYAGRRWHGVVHIYARCRRSVAPDYDPDGVLWHLELQQQPRRL